MANGPPRRRGTRPVDIGEFRRALEDLREEMALHREQVREYMSGHRTSYEGDLEGFRQLHAEGDELFARFEQLIHRVDTDAFDRPAQRRFSDSDDAP